VYEKSIAQISELSELPFPLNYPVAGRLAVNGIDVVIVSGLPIACEFGPFILFFLGKKVPVQPGSMAYRQHMSGNTA
jgi:hypothetical protein